MTKLRPCPFCGKIFRVMRDDIRFQTTGESETETELSNSNRKETVISLLASGTEADESIIPYIV